MTDRTEKQQPSLTSHLEIVKSPFPAYFACATICYAIFTPNPLETAWSGILLYILFRNFWWQNQPGIILFAFIAPFIEIHTAVFGANSASQTLDDQFFGTGKETFWLSTIGLLFVMSGFKWAGANSRKINLPSKQQYKRAAQEINQIKLLVALIIFYLISFSVDILIPYNNSFRQIEEFLSQGEKAVLMTIALHFVITKQKPYIILSLFLYLTIVGFYNYFSSWKEPIIILILATLYRYREFKIPHLLRMSPLLLVAISFVFVWQTVKDDYRQFLSGEARGQVVNVSQSEALIEFRNLALDAYETGQVLSDNTVTSTYKRAGYLEYFSNAVKKVPNEIPHERGRLIAQTAEFVFIPRFLNPNKGLKDDTGKVEKYTDFYFGQNSFSSFSLSHYCEAYIDWGRWGMMIHLFLYGAMGALIIKLTQWRTQTMNPLVQMGLTWVCILPWCTFQSDLVFVLGQCFWGAFCHLVIFFPLYKLADHWITTPL